MKKIIMVLLSFLLVLSCASCNKKVPPASNPPAEEPQPDKQYSFVGDEISHKVDENFNVISTTMTALYKTLRNLSPSPPM